MKRYVLDTFAIIAYFEGEDRGRPLIQLFKQNLSGDNEMYLSIINWGEMYYIALREGGTARAELYRTTIAKYPITLIEANKELTLQAAQFKAFHKISFADAFAAALAKLKKAELITGDKEFKSLEKEIKIHWL